MKIERRHLLSTFLGTGLLALLLLLVSLDGLFVPDPPETVALRDVQIYVPPPPPPPPPADARDPSEVAGEPLAIQNLDTPVVLDLMDLDVELAAGRLGDFGVGAGGIGDGVGGDWGAVSMSDLDSLPYVISAPIFVWPADLIERNINVFSVRLSIQIDKDGRAYPMSVVENPYPWLNDQILEFASNTRFSPPRMLGIPVRAAYIWPVKFERK